MPNNIRPIKTAKNVANLVVISYALIQATRGLVSLGYELGVVAKHKIQTRKSK